MRQMDFKVKQKRVFKIGMMTMVLSGILSFSSCKDEAAKLASGNDGNGGKVDSTVSCQTWDGTNICLQMQGTGSGASATPTLSFKGLDRINGNVSLFSDSGCTTTIGSPVTATTATVLVAAPAQKTFSAEYYAQYIHTDSTRSPCLGPVAWRVKESLSLSSSQLGFYSTPSFSVSGLIVHNGTVQLFSDSSCTTAASGAVVVSASTASITTDALAPGEYAFYVQHKDTNNNKGDCTGPVAYTVEVLSLTLSSPSSPQGVDSTPTFSVSELVVHNGTVQLFSDSSCTTSASGAVVVSASTASITADALAPGEYAFYVQHTDTNNKKGDCTGPVTYTREAVSLTLSSPSSPLGMDSTPTFSVSGLVVHNGTVQLFSDSSCTTSAQRRSCCFGIDRFHYRRRSGSRGICFLCPTYRCKQQKGGLYGSGGLYRGSLEFDLVFSKFTTGSGFHPDVQCVGACRPQRNGSTVQRFILHNLRQCDGSRLIGDGFRHGRCPDHFKQSVLYPAYGFK